MRAEECRKESFVFFLKFCIWILVLLEPGYMVADWLGKQASSLYDLLQMEIEWLLHGNFQHRLPSNETRNISDENCPGIKRNITEEIRRLKQIRKREDSFSVAKGLTIRLGLSVLAVVSLK